MSEEGRQTIGCVQGQGKREGSKKQLGKEQRGKGKETRSGQRETEL